MVIDLTRFSRWREKMSEAMPSETMPSVANALAIKRVEFGLRLSTAILITFAVGFVLLHLSVRFGVQFDNLDPLTFRQAGGAFAIKGR
jgi:hypothetical protein